MTTLLNRLPVLLVLYCAYVRLVFAWGVAGHQMVGAIAEIHLHQTALDKIHEVLPGWSKGHLAPIAAWADRVRYVFPWSKTLHYINVENDYPPKQCVFDENVKNDRNVLNAIHNYTQRVEEMKPSIEGDHALRFLVHFVGDVHQPLHLTGRNRGGNGDKITFEGRGMSLHGLWDTTGITKNIREQTNYTKPLPSSQIEDVLTGSIYDPYVRLILWEGIRTWWKDDLMNWISCQGLSASSPRVKQDPHQITLSPSSSSSLKPTAVTSDCFPIWANITHALNCEYVYPQDFDKHPDESNPPELNTVEYWGRISQDNVFEHLLAKAGLRLAALLNTILSSQEEIERVGLINLDWIDRAERVEKTKMWRFLGSTKGWF